MTASYYHRIPEDYCRHLGGLRWSDKGDAVEHADGLTFAFVPQIGLFLEGLASNRRLIDFGFVLHLLDLLRPGGLARAEPLRKAFQEAGRPLRNAGVFFAELCKHVPAVAEPFHFEPHEWVVQSSLLWFYRPPTESEIPPLDPAAFEDHVLRRLEAYQPQDLRYWLRNGRGPIKEAGTRLVRLIREVARAKSHSLAEVIVELSKRERLAGAAPYVARLLSALALPRRRLARHELPVGGYSDVATRGQLEQILPSQFVLDDLEFVRRFAANELLFFRREEPHARTKEELVLVLDQGVRTWGDVRLVLTAAVFALAKRVASGKVPLRLATTGSSGKALDCRTADAAALGDLLEASDLTPHPAAALERALEEPADVLRDIVLLTHPCTLAEADVCAAARRLGKNCRLFAAAVDGQGQGLLAELRHGTAVPLTRFRIDWQQAAPPEPRPLPGRTIPSATPWQGDIEPIGFPFRFGVTGPLGPFAFDASGEWLLLTGPNGMVYLERTDGTYSEALPRGFRYGAVLNNVEAVLGVPGGFAVCGRVDAELLAFHYDLTRRTCSARTLGAPEGGQRSWHFLTRFHSLVVKEQTINYGVDLASGERGSCNRPSPGGASRVQQACAQADLPQLQPPFIAVLNDHPSKPYISPMVWIDADGSVGLFLPGAEAKWFTPLADGRPALVDARALAGQLCGNTLALSVWLDRPTEKRRLWVFRLPRGEVIGEFALRPAGEPTFQLAPFGNWLAWQPSDSIMFCNDLTTVSTHKIPLAGRNHHPVDVETGEGWLAIRAGGGAQLLRWNTGSLSQAASPDDSIIKKAVAAAGLRYPGVTSRSVNHGMMTRLGYDYRRFVKTCSAQLIVVVDMFGQVLILDRSQNLICMCFVFREQLAVCMPDGTRLGPAALTGGPETIGAAEKIGQALLAASKSKGRT